MNYWTEEKRAEAIAATRRICDFLEANPDFAMPSSFSGPHHVQSWDVMDGSEGERRAWFLKNAALLGPDARAIEQPPYFILLRDFGGVALTLMMHRTHLCERKVETVERPAAVERVTLECPAEIKALGFTDPGEVEAEAGR